MPVLLGHKTISTKHPCILVGKGLNPRKSKISAETPAGHALKLFRLYFVMVACNSGILYFNYELEKHSHLQTMFV